MHSAPQPLYACVPPFIRLCHILDGRCWELCLARCAAAVSGQWARGLGGAQQLRRQGSALASASASSSAAWFAMPCRCPTHGDHSCNEPPWPRAPCVVTSSSCRGVWCGLQKPEVAAGCMLTDAHTACTATSASATPGGGGGAYCIAVSSADPLHCSEEPNPVCRSRPGARCLDACEPWAHVAAASWGARHTYDAPGRRRALRRPFKAANLQVHLQHPIGFSHIVGVLHADKPTITNIRTRAARCATGRMLACATTNRRY